MKASPILAIVAALFSLSLPACQMHAKEEEAHHENQKVVVTSPHAKDVVVTQQYVCQIRSQRYIDVCALQDGFLEEVLVKEGQAVKAGEVMFKILPTLYKARLNAELAEANLAQLEFNNTKRLFEYPKPIVSIQEVAISQAKLDKANAKAQLAAAEVDFTIIRARFDGIVDRLNKQLGSLVEKKDCLTTLSDNSTMWVYFNVPEARYLEYKGLQNKNENQQQLKLADARIEVVLADGKTFGHTANDTVTIEGKFNNETGNIAFRADFPNPERLLRHGQTGTVLIKRKLKNAIVIPQRATFEILDKQYVYVVDKEHVVHQRWITIENELDDIFVMKSGLDENDKIILEGVRQVHEGQKLEEFEFKKPEEALANMKFHAE